MPKWAYTATTGFIIQICVPFLYKFTMEIPTTSLPLHTGSISKWSIADPLEKVITSNFVPAHFLHNLRIHSHICDSRLEAGAGTFHKPETKSLNPDSCLTSNMYSMRMFFNEGVLNGPGEMAHWLRMRTILSEDPNLVPSSQCVCVSQ